MPFDPKKVNRTTLRKGMVREMVPFDTGDEVVHACDFDALLEQHHHLQLIAEQTIRDLCYESGTLAGTPRMEFNARICAKLTRDMLHHSPVLNWNSILYAKEE